MFDTVIVGGGSAGAILASRLSEQGSHRVLLCEAGPDISPSNQPKEIKDGFPGLAWFNPKYHWTALRVTTQPVGNGGPDGKGPPLRPYPQGRVMGGGSSINGQLANRGAPSDYDEWVSRGAEGWGWEEVLPFFKKIERDLDYDGPLHGKDGRIPISRIPQHRRSQVSHAFADACSRLGFKPILDQNGEFEDGYFPTAFSNENEERVSSAVGYLDAETRRRPNLTILADCSVTELLFEGLRCVGVKALVNNQTQEFRARQVVLSSGAIHSPAHLLRAGIGPVGHLKSLGIPVLLAREGVGQRLMDHPAISLSYFIRPEARMKGPTRRHFQMALRYSSGLPGIPAGDMYCAALSKSAWHAVGKQLGTILTFVNKTYSETGQVKLRSRDAGEEPIVEFNLLSDHRDMERLKQGFHQMAKLHASGAFADISDNPFPSSLSDRVRKLGTFNFKNRIITGAAATLLDGPASLRGYIIDNIVVEGATYDQVLSDPEALEAFIRKEAMGVWHASCSCRMGDAADPMSVVDTTGRVHGINGLRVVDASIFPVIPCANTNLPTMMVAEKIAEDIKAEYAHNLELNRY